ncbi:MAG: ATP-dependent helicase [Candidatus Limnocylindrales bacterium]
MLTSSVTERLDRLAPDQQAAATMPPGPVLCVAPAGSGKTTTLVARTCWLIADQSVLPERISALTFNRRAAEELRERLMSALAPLGVTTAAPPVRTFHALGLEILRDARQSPQAIIDRSNLLVELGEASAPADIRRLDDAFSRLKLDLAVDTAVVRAEAEAEERAGRPVGQVIRAFLRYEAALAARSAVDFDDLVPRAVEALQGDAALLDRWRARAEHLLVDEVQDVDRSQLRLALLLAAPANRIFLVGDDDQTIYAWRLADVRRVLGLAAQLPGLQRVDLVTNYRCPAPVVQRAVRLVAVNRERFAKEIRPRADAAGSLFLDPDPGDELARARRLLRSWPAGPGETRAVLARTNAELSPFAAVALELGIPYRAEDDGLLLDDPALDHVLDAAAAAENDHPGPPALTLARMSRMSPMSSPGASGPSKAVAGWDAQLLASAREWALAYGTVAELRSALARARRQRTELRRSDALLVLATIHGTKGLEFDHVACVGLDEGRFPNARSISESVEPGRALEEERRLAYVAWTRARRSLVLLYDAAAPSVFLREAFSPNELGLPGATPLAGR